MVKSSSATRGLLAKSNHTQSSTATTTDQDEPVKHCKDYQLNETKAMKKKLEACDRKEDVIIKYTDGGIKLLFQTGPYELFQVAASTYFKTP